MPFFEKVLQKIFFIVETTQRDTAARRDHRTSRA
jgi:hypothetical protein